MKLLEFSLSTAELRHRLLIVHLLLLVALELLLVKLLRSLVLLSLVNLSKTLVAGCSTHNALGASVKIEGR